MHPEYAAGLNAAGKMSDKDMEDSDKAYDIMKKRGKGLAMSKGKGVQKEETQIDELAPLITSVLAAKAGAKVAKGVMKGIKGKSSFGPNKMGPQRKPQPKPAPKPQPKPGMGRAGGAVKAPARPIPNTTVVGKRMIRGQAAKTKTNKPTPAYGPGNQMQSYDYGMEEGAMKELVTKKQEDERLAKRKKDSQYSDKEVRMGKGVAFDKRYKGGNMTGAYKTIKKIKKGFGDHPNVADAL